MINSKKFWANENRFSHHREINPCHQPVSFNLKNRRVERQTFRLRSGFCLLNHRPLMMRKHTTGHCDTCNVNETRYNFIIAVTLRLYVLLRPSRVKSLSQLRFEIDLSSIRHAEKINMLIFWGRTLELSSHHGESG
jgi:hypothetical protein